MKSWMKLILVILGIAVIAFFWFQRPKEEEQSRPIQETSAPELPSQARSLTSGIMEPGLPLPGPLCDPYQPCSGKEQGICDAETKCSFQAPLEKTPCDAWSDPKDQRKYPTTCVAVTDNRKSVCGGNVSGDCRIEYKGCCLPVRAGAFKNPSEEKPKSDASDQKSTKKKKKVIKSK